MKTIAILQSNYIPWKGVFDLINQVDEFVFLEDVQFTKRDWRTRNQIFYNSKKIWLSIPVKKANRETLLNSIEIDETQSWRTSHYEKIKQSYSTSPFFDKYKWILDEIYNDDSIVNLSQFNIKITKLIAAELGIKTVMKISTDYSLKSLRDDKIINLCRILKADVYLSGPSGKNYLNVQKFKNEKIEVKYIDYNGYPIYKQNSSEFDHQVSVIDLLFSVGPKAWWYVWGWRNS